MTIKEFNSELSHFDTECVKGNSGYIVKTIPTRSWSGTDIPSGDNSIKFAEIPYDDCRFSLYPVEGWLNSKQIYSLCAEFAFTNPIDRISSRNQDRIIDLMRIKGLLNEKYFPKQRAIHFISKRINELSRRLNG